MQVLLWWELTGSNRWHSACRADALPAELNSQTFRADRTVSLSTGMIISPQSGFVKSFFTFSRNLFCPRFCLTPSFPFLYTFSEPRQSSVPIQSDFRADGIFGCAEICGLKRKSNVVFGSFCHINRKLTEHSVPSRFGRIVVFVFVTERFGIARRFKQLAERSFLSFREDSTRWTPDRNSRDGLGQVEK